MEATRRCAAVLFVTNVLNGTVAAGGKTVLGGTVVRLVINIPAASVAAPSCSSPASGARA
jgi:hypothetical protein